jgi:dihydroorotate dehydrogenase electron transfer subunit
MAQMRVGESAGILGPMGNSFTPPQPGERAVLLGGGVGIPPMVALADSLEQSGHEAWEAYVGVGTTADAGCFVGFDEGAPASVAAKVFRSTMDGSIGFEGHVVAAWLDQWDRQGCWGDAPVRVYACGPMVMLRALAAEAAARGFPCEVSVETMMGCGMGICMSCVIESSAACDPQKRKTMSPYDRWLLACIKGPVFDGGAVVLDEGEFLH